MFGPYVISRRTLLGEHTGIPPPERPIVHLMSHSCNFILGK